MKVLIYLCILSVVGLSMAGPLVQSRGCIYVLGKCYRECEEGTHAYTTGCGYLMPEATCDNPNPEQETRGMICDFSACYCDSPTVRDKTANKCVPLEECPNNEFNEPAKPKQ